MNYFQDSEFACKCGCALENVSDEIKAKLDEARAIAGVPFVITSGSRCPSHNRGVGGLPSSSHLTGLAIDIAVSGSRERFEVLSALMLVGFERIGIAKSFIHVDIDKSKPEKVIWLYR